MNRLVSNQLLFRFDCNATKGGGMGSIAVIEDLLSRGRESIKMLDGLSGETLYAAPALSIAWQVWRMGRSVDYNISPLLGRQQLWTDTGWHERFGMEPDPKDFQPGFPPPNDIVSTFRAPSADLLGDYLLDALDLASEYLATLTVADLDREIDAGRYANPVTIGIRLVSVGVSLAQSAGAIRYRLWMVP
jgi:hypothetical protein